MSFRHIDTGSRHPRIPSPVLMTCAVLVFAVGAGVTLAAQQVGGPRPTQFLNNMPSLPNSAAEAIRRVAASPDMNSDSSLHARGNGIIETITAATEALEQEMASSATNSLAANPFAAMAQMMQQQGGNVDINALVQQAIRNNGAGGAPGAPGGAAAKRGVTAQSFEPLAACMNTTTTEQGFLPIVMDIGRASDSVETCIKESEAGGLAAADRCPKNASGFAEPACEARAFAAARNNAMAAAQSLPMQSQAGLGRFVDLFRRHAMRCEEIALDSRNSADPATKSYANGTLLNLMRWVGQYAGMREQITLTMSRANDVFPPPQR